jgi:methylated-DNA-protein-cysteine methyltransferase-like protein
MDQEQLAMPTTATSQYRELVWRIVHSIPAGKVSSYGEIAQHAGLPRGARLVGRILSQLPEGSTLPWHRVLNSRGCISFPPGSAQYFEQRSRLLAEGVALVNERIDWRQHRWQPTASAPAGKRPRRRQPAA